MDEAYETSTQRTTQKNIFPTLRECMMPHFESLLTQSPEIRHGRPCITGTRITVHRIAIWYKLGYSAEEIFHQYPHLTLAGVYAALTYYHANRDVIDAEIEAEDAEERRLEQEYARQSPVLQ
jgi:uncharacterized protein (DUF433 family)